MTTLAHALKVEPAEGVDASALHELVNGFARRGEMLPRTMAEIAGTLGDFSVVRDGGRVVACGALHVLGKELAEIRSLAVREDRQGQGLGALLVRAHLQQARDLELRTVFALTYQPSFFELLGFRQADVMSLPLKVWGECYRCPKFPTCDEIAVVLDLKAAS